MKDVVAGALCLFGTCLAFLVGYLVIGYCKGNEGRPDYKKIHLGQECVAYKVIEMQDFLGKEFLCVSLKDGVTTLREEKKRNAESIKRLQHALSKGVKPRLGYIVEYGDHQYNWEKEILFDKNMKDESKRNFRIMSGIFRKMSSAGYESYYDLEEVLEKFEPKTQKFSFGISFTSASNKPSENYYGRGNRRSGINVSRDDDCYYSDSEEDSCSNDHNGNYYGRGNCRSGINVSRDGDCCSSDSEEDSNSNVC